MFQKVLASYINEGYHDLENMVITKINGKCKAGPFLRAELDRDIISNFMSINSYQDIFNL